MRIVRFIVAALVATCIFSGLALAQVGALGPFVTAVTIPTSPTQIVPANPSRRSIQICNAGTTVLWIWPGNATAVSAYELPALSSGTTVCFSPPTGGGGDAGRAGAAWYASSVTSAGNASAFEW